MIEKKESNKIFTYILSLIILIAVAVLVYTNLPESEDDDKSISTNSTIQKNTVFLNISVNDQLKSYTISDLEKMESYSGIGGKISKKQTTTGPFNITGVKLSTILSEFELPANYNITAIGNDGYDQIYTYNESMGNVLIYNDTRIEKGFGGVTLIIAYKIDGKYITDPEEGPIQLVFVDDYFTASNYWAKMLENIEIIEV